MRFYLILLFLFSTPLFAQKQTRPEIIAGVWTGYLYNDTTRQKLEFELAISHLNNQYTGYTYTVFLIDSRREVGVKAVKVKEKKGILYIEDEKLIDNNYGQAAPKGVRTFIELHYTNKDSADILRGLWKTNRTREYSPLTGNVFLQKKSEPEQTAIISKLRQLDLTQNLSFMRKNGSLSVTARADSSHKRNSNEGIMSINRSSGTNNFFEKKPAPARTDKDEERETHQKAVLSPLFQNDTVGRTNLSGMDILIPPDKNKSLTVRKKDKEFADLPETFSDTTIVPDTTIVNEEITIFMFPKGNEVQTESENQKTADKEEKYPLSSPALSKGEKAIIQAENQVSYGAAENLSEREIETIRTIEIVRDSLVFSLFDNGIIDGDTVSVLVNGKVVMPKVGLLAVATNKTIHLSPDMGDSISIILYAENLGSIAPNTGLLVIRDGAANHEIRFSGDLRKNSAIILKRKNKIYESFHKQ